MSDHGGQINYGINVPLYPCDRGVPGATVRGWHHFQAGPTGAVVCILCGRPAATTYTGSGANAAAPGADGGAEVTGL